MKQTIVVNLFGGPSIGKSTAAADLFTRLKMLGVDAELAPEYMKELIWDERVTTFDDQLYITAKQNRRIMRLIGKVDVAITDSPIPLGAIYARRRNDPNADLFDQLFHNIFITNRNINIVLPRIHKHVDNGRIHGEDESLTIDQDIERWLSERRQSYIKMNTYAEMDEIVKCIVGLLSQP